MSELGFRIIKIFIPDLNCVKTYKSNTPIVRIGSGGECDLILYLPSINPIHLVVNYDDKKIVVVGNDVHCDTFHLQKGSSSTFSNESVIRIHNIFMSFLAVESLTGIDQFDTRLINISSQYDANSPFLQILNNDNVLNTDSNLKIAKEELGNRNLIVDSYQKEMGDFSEMPVIQSADEDRSLGVASIGQSVLELTQEELRDSKHIEPTAVEIEHVLDEKIAANEHAVVDALQGTPNISVEKHETSDLGNVAIENEILHEAKEKLASDDVKKPVEIDDMSKKMVDAGLNSIDQLKTEIKDTIKEEIRDSITSMVHEEAKEQVSIEVEKCLQQSKFQQVVEETVIDKASAIMTENDRREESHSIDLSTENKKQKLDQESECLDEQKKMKINDHDEKNEQEFFDENNNKTNSPAPEKIQPSAQGDEKENEPVHEFLKETNALNEEVEIDSKGVEKEEDATQEIENDTSSKPVQKKKATKSRTSLRAKSRKAAEKDNEEKSNEDETEQELKPQELEDNNTKDEQAKEEQKPVLKKRAGRKRAADQPEKDNKTETTKRSKKQPIVDEEVPLKLKKENKKAQEDDNNLNHSDDNLEPVVTKPKRKASVKQTQKDTKPTKSTVGSRAKNSTRKK